MEEVKAWGTRWFGVKGWRKGWLAVKKRLEEEGEGQVAGAAASVVGDDW